MVFKSHAKGDAVQRSAGAKPARGRRRQEIAAARRRTAARTFLTGRDPVDGWIKATSGLHEKPEVLKAARALSQQLGIPLPMATNVVVGALIKVWQWADRTTQDGFINGVTLDDVDRVADLAGLAAQMVQCGWIKLEAGDNPVGIVLVNYQRHMGKSAKRRALDNMRKAQARARK